MWLWGKPDFVPKFLSSSAVLVSEHTPEPPNVGAPIGACVPIIVPQRHVVCHRPPVVPAGVVATRSGRRHNVICAFPKEMDLFLEKRQAGELSLPYFLCVGIGWHSLPRWRIAVTEWRTETRNYVAICSSFVPVCNWTIDTVQRKATLDSGLRRGGDADCGRLASREQTGQGRQLQSRVLYNCVNLLWHVSAEVRKAIIRLHHYYHHHYNTK